MTRDNEWRALCAWVASDLPPPRRDLNPAIGAIVGTVGGVALWALGFLAWRAVT